MFKSKNLTQRQILISAMFCCVSLATGFRSASADGSIGLSKAGERWLAMPRSTMIATFDDPRFSTVNCEAVDAELSKFFSDSKKQLADCRVDATDPNPESLCQVYYDLLDNIRYDAFSNEGRFYLQKQVQIAKGSLATAELARDKKVPLYRVASARWVESLFLREVTLVAAPGKGSWLEKISALRGAKTKEAAVREPEKLSFALIGKELACDLRAGRAIVLAKVDARAQSDSTDKTPEAFWSLRQTLMNVLDRTDLDFTQKTALSGFKLAEAFGTLRALDAESSSESLLWDTLSLLSRDGGLQPKDFRTYTEFRDALFPSFSQNIIINAQAQWAAGR